jgi:hypothetical protein
MNEKLDFVNPTGLVPGASQEQIAQVEAELGFVFPKSMRDYFLAHDGEQPVNSKFPQKGREPLTLNQMWTLRDAHGLGSFRISCRLCLENPYWPNWLVPFANDPGDWSFCFSVREDDYGAIFLHRFEFMGEDKEVMFLSHDFSAFLDSLI